MDFVGGTTDVFGSLPDIVVDSRNLGFAHPVGPHNPGAKPLRMVDQDMKRRPLDGNARSLEPDTQLSENIVNETLIARVVCQPVRNVAVRMRGNRIDFWRRVHILLPGSDLVDGTAYVVSPLNGVNGVRRALPFTPFGNSRGFRLNMVRRTASRHYRAFPRDHINGMLMLSLLFRYV